MQTEKVRLTKERETYLPTLYGKALDSRAEHPILGDKFADEIIQHIDFDFNKLKLASDGAVTLPWRAKQLDGWVREFLNTHTKATVLHLGCGLDSRVFRIDPAATVRWYDVDLPDVIELRKRLYPKRHDYEMIASSVTDLGWLDKIAGDRPVIVVAEGLSGYLPPKDGIALFNRISEQFPSGQICFDIYSHFMAGMINLTVRLTTLRSKPTAGGTSVFLPWSMDDPHELEKQVPCLKLLDAVSFLTMPEMVPLLIHSRVQGMAYRVMKRMRWYRQAIQHLRYEF